MNTKYMNIFQVKNCCRQSYFDYLQRFAAITKTLYGLYLISNVWIMPAFETCQWMYMKLQCRYEIMQWMEIWRVLIGSSNSEN